MSHPQPQTPTLLLPLLHGVWSLQSYTLHPASPTSTTAPIHPMGPSPSGLLIYHPSGYMSAQLSEPGQPHYKSPILAEATTVERAESARRSVAYSGRFWVERGADAQGSVVVHHAEVSLFPNWQGREQRRRVEVSEGGRGLVLSTEDAFEAFGEMWWPTLVWEKREGHDTLSGSVDATV